MVFIEVVHEQTTLFHRILKYLALFPLREEYSCVVDDLSTIGQKEKSLERPGMGSYAGPMFY